jgi:phosphoglycerol geranylgeranyltransferase
VIGDIEKYLLKKIEREHVIHMTLIDPEEVTLEEGAFLAKESQTLGSSAIMVGGSTITTSSHLDNVVEAIKKIIKIPVILFPNNITGISQHADAIWFMSLLNSSDPYFITGVQVLAAPLVRKFGLEVIPMGYLIIGEGGSAAVIGRASPIPYNKPELSVAHALAAQYLGMRFVYLEAGSGVSKPVPAQMVRMVKGVIDVPLIVGGGIRSREQAREIAAAGADIIVTSTALEEAKRSSLRTKINNIMQGIKEGIRNRYER